MWQGSSTWQTCLSWINFNTEVSYHRPRNDQQFVASMFHPLFHPQTCHGIIGLRLMTPIIYRTVEVVLIFSVHQHIYWLNFPAATSTWVMSHGATTWTIILLNYVCSCVVVIAMPCLALSSLHQQAIKTNFSCLLPVNPGGWLKFKVRQVSTKHWCFIFGIHGSWKVLELRVKPPPHPQQPWQLELDAWHLH